VDTVWYFAWMIFLVLVSTFSVVEMVRNRHRTDVVGDRGVPRLVVPLFGDD
jgi:predicted outer membrane lipoprotein